MDGCGAVPSAPGAVPAEVVAQAAGDQEVDHA